MAGQRKIQFTAGDLVGLFEIRPASEVFDVHNVEILRFGKLKIVKAP